MRVTFFREGRDLPVACKSSGEFHRPRENSGHVSPSCPLECFHRPSPPNGCGIYMWPEVAVSHDKTGFMSSGIVILYYTRYTYTPDHADVQAKKSCPIQQPECRGVFVKCSIKGDAKY